MNDSQIVLALIISAGLTTLTAILLWRFVTTRRRTESFSEPFPSEWRQLLEHSLPLYTRIPPPLRLKLEPLVRAFLSDVRFVGCQGLEVTNEMRLVIATQACLLVVIRNPDAYTTLGSVLIYPDKFVVNEPEEDESGVVTEGENILAGQSVDDTRIILSWQDVRESGTEGDAYNVVLHEFAHYLDNSVDGALSDSGTRRESFEAWHDVLDREYEALCKAVEHGEGTLIDPYGAEHPAEFFAVATETFFERPLQMQGRHTALYAALKQFYGLDPAAW
ncbi:MAG: M90 family metallopeptidase [Gammaproteobacteria bacterium]